MTGFTCDECNESHWTVVYWDDGNQLCPDCALEKCKVKIEVIENFE